MAFWERQNYGDSTKISGRQGSEERTKQAGRAQRVPGQWNAVTLTVEPQQQTPVQTHGTHGTEGALKSTTDSE